MLIHRPYTRSSATLRLLLFALAVMLLSVPAMAFAADPIPFQDNDSIAEIQAKIAHNGYQFTVAPNRIFSLSQSEKAKLFSKRQPTQAQINAAASACPDPGPLNVLPAAALPASYDSRNVDGKSYINPVKDQMNCGSCYSFGATGAAEGSYNKINELTGTARKSFSESYIAWCLGSLPEYTDHFYGCDGADYDYQELQALVDRGVTYEANFPYQDYEPASCTHWGDPVVKFESWHRLPCGDRDAIKSAILQYGAVDAAIEAGSAFDAYDSGIYEDTLTSCGSTPCYYTPTNHAITLVGWNDEGGYWILRNSWGSDWGESGYMRIKYGSARVDCAATYLVAPAASHSSTSAIIPLLLN